MGFLKSTQISHGVAPPRQLPEPPAMDRGIYQLEDGSYFNVSRFRRTPCGKWKHLVPVMQKLANGAAVKIMVLGGSFTLGGGCSQHHSNNGNLTGRDCAWAARLLHWLRLAFPRSTIHLQNKAQGGSPSAVILGGIGLRNFSGVDLVFVDSLVNDAYNENKRWNSANGSVAKGWGTVFTISVAFEELLRSVQQLAPKSAVYAILAGCPPCLAGARAQRQVLDFYGVPYLDFAQAVEAAPELWMPKVAHAGFRTHQAVADMLALSLGRFWDHMLQMRLEDMDVDDAKLDFSKAYHPAQYRNRFPRCMYPCSVLSASGPSTVQPKILAGNWTLYEDRPGKPGWISTEPGSVMQVELCFRQKPTFTFTHLRSYEKLGAGRIFLNGRNVTIPGKYARGARVSQSETLFSNAAEDFLSRNFEAVVGFNVKPNSTLQMRIVNLKVGVTDNKMKVIEVLSC